MVALFALPLTGLAVLSRKFGGSWLFPPAAYLLYWSIIVLGSSAIPFRDHHLMMGAALVFTVSGVFFFLGGLVALQIGKRKRRSGRQISEKRKRAFQIFIIVFNIALILLIPAFIQALREAGDSLRIDRFAVGARLALGQEGRGGVPRFFLSLSSVASFLAFYSAWLYNGTRRDKWALSFAMIGPLAINMLTFARTPVFTLVIGVLAIMLIKKRIKPLQTALVLLLVLIVSFSMGALLEKNPRPGPSRDAISGMVDSLAVYYMGGPIGFGQVMDNPGAVGDKGLSLRFFTQAIQSIGLDIDIPNNVLGYFDARFGNIYTAYFAYWLDGKWLGVTFYAFIAGLVSSIIYLLACKSYLIPGAALGLVFSALLNSAVGDGLLYSAVPWLLIVGIGLVFVYGPWPRLVSRTRGGAPQPT
jgi:oligosaccharide repeat unit polymerase